MNYLAELSAFDKWLETNELSTSAIALWFGLMQTANRANWKNPLTVAISTLERRSGLERRAVYRARNTLKQAGLIDFRERGSNRCSEYTINSVLCIFDTQTDTQSVTHTVTQNVTQSVTHSDTILRLDKTKQGNAPIAPKGAALFSAFWEAYPRKVGKDAARKAFDKRSPTRELLDAMLSAIEAQKRSEQWQRDGGQYIPHPATWLNGGRWMDEPSAITDGWARKRGATDEEYREHPPGWDTL